MHQVPEKKPGLDDYYVKDAYKDICDYKRRTVDYYDDKLRFNSLYNTDYLKNLKEEDYSKGRDRTVQQGVNRYNYCHDPNLVQMVTDKPTWKSEDFIVLIN